MRNGGEEGENTFTHNIEPEWNDYHSTNCCLRQGITWSRWKEGRCWVCVTTHCILHILFPFHFFFFTNMWSNLVQGIWLHLPWFPGTRHMGTTTMLGSACACVSAPFQREAGFTSSSSYSLITSSSPPVARAFAPFQFHRTFLGPCGCDSPSLGKPLSLSLSFCHLFWGCWKDIDEALHGWMRCFVLEQAIERL